MVIERFKDGDAIPVYRRFRDRGRLAPEGLSYVSSWVEPASTLLSVDGHGQSIRFSMNGWRTGATVDFEVHQVIESAEAAEQIASRL